MPLEPDLDEKCNHSAQGLAAGRLELTHVPPSVCGAEHILTLQFPASQAMQAALEADKFRCT